MWLNNRHLKVNKLSPNSRLPYGPPAPQLMHMSPLILTLLSPASHWADPALSTLKTGRSRALPSLPLPSPCICARAFLPLSLPLPLCPSPACKDKASEWPTWSCTALCCYPLTSTPILHPSLQHRGLLTLSPTLQVHSPLRAFAFAVPPTWTTFSQFTPFSPSDLSLNVTRSEEPALAALYEKQTQPCPHQDSPPRLPDDFLHGICHPLTSSLSAPAPPRNRLHENMTFTCWSGRLHLE